MMLNVSEEIVITIFCVALHSFLLQKNIYKVYVLHFREEENKCLQNSLTMSTILLLKAVFFNVFQ